MGLGGEENRHSRRLSWWRARYLTHIWLARSDIWEIPWWGIHLTHIWLAASDIWELPRWGMYLMRHTFKWQDLIWYLTPTYYKSWWQAGYLRHISLTRFYLIFGAHIYYRGTCLTHRLRQLSASSKVTFPIIKSCVPSIWCLLEIRHDTKLSCQRRALFWEQI